MKVKVSEVMNSIEILKRLVECKLKFGISYKVSKLITECNDIASKFDQFRIDALQEFANLNEEKNQYEFDKDKPENLENFNKAIQGALAEELEIDFEMLTVEELDAIEDFTIEPGAVNLMSWFVKAA